MKSQSTFLFTSESVGEGHPDKICDQVADAVLDECLKQNPLSKVAIEVAVRPGQVIVFGVVHFIPQLNIDAIVRFVLKDIGYSSSDQELDYQTCDVMDCVELHPSLLSGISSGLEALDNEPAGDQGMAFGYATDETPQPLTLDLAHRITRNLKAAHSKHILPWLRPDTKAQVTVEYVEDKGRMVPTRVHNVVITAQHEPGVSIESLRQEILDKVVRKSIPAKYLDGRTAYHIQPTGDIGVSPSGKFAGVTGRKIVVDTYGGWGAHGGGAFSGKDFRQIDRSAAYVARWIAKSLVHHGLAHRCLIQLSYSIGIAEPLSIFVDTFHTSQFTSDQLKKIICNNFDLRPAAIAKDLNLINPIYYQTAKNGHFTNDEFLWEQPFDLVL
ncbi:methionine adenosyltransferase [Aspergillus campestris IBT 28561]|uniref:S-adenosylmethionine synthase n=1 Tax=Aspergillus campestris (strain IBT 28561) TaxID=1392248 RepID=A0A2I1D472_ASPC2|nr:methionine adenosyltransferase [Aspergillus campestris IBT 28561]PKY04682.1 methionine adenosyltransferase [Aspergillus campestris IBT 28561]